MTYPGSYKGIWAVTSLIQLEGYTLWSSRSVRRKCSTNHGNCNPHVRIAQIVVVFVCWDLVQLHHFCHFSGPTLSSCAGEEALFFLHCVTQFFFSFLSAVLL